jgi:hypothetical protein
MRWVLVKERGAGGYRAPLRMNRLLEFGFYGIRHAGNEAGTVF